MKVCTIKTSDQYTQSITIYDVNKELKEKRKIIFLIARRISIYRLHRETVAVQFSKYLTGFPKGMYICTRQNFPVVGTRNHNAPINYFAY